MPEPRRLYASFPLPSLQLPSPQEETLGEKKRWNARFFFGLPLRLNLRRFLITLSGAESADAARRVYVGAT